MSLAASNTVRQSDNCASPARVVDSIAIADWYHVNGDKIAAIRTILDTGPFKAPVAGESAVDPVCGMTVGKASATATRTLDGVTYYFCSIACAEAFDRDRSSKITASR
jgi:YHS domain-containing protein